MKTKKKAPKNALFDCHVHSHFSDGSQSPEKIINCAREENVKLISLTDHDTCLGTEEFMHYANKAGITVFSGIEISAAYKGIDVHVLGFNIRHELSCVEDLFKSNVEERRRRLETTLKILAEMKIFKVTEKEIVDFYKYPGPVLSILHVIDFMANAMKQDFFEIKKLFKRGGIAWVPFDHSALLSAEDAVEIITKKLGGKAVLAHPGKFLKAASYYDDNMHQNSWKLLREMLLSLKERGLSGIESVHPVHSIAQQAYFIEIGLKMGLTSTAGSDHHGRFKKRKKLGIPGISMSNMLELVTG